MTKTSIHGSRSCDDADSTLGRLVDELTRKIATGERIDVEAVIALHPDHAAELRRLVPALRALAGLASSRSRELPDRSAMGFHPRPTSAVIGDYRILREIGRGGMGVVYEAEQRSLNRRVALKVLPLASALDARRFQRFQLEAQAAACLHHQNIVPVFAIGTEGGVPYYAMQYIDGRSLAELIRELRRAEGREAEGPSPGAHLGHGFPDLTTTALARSFVGAKYVGNAQNHLSSTTSPPGCDMTTPESLEAPGRITRPSTPMTQSGTSVRTRAYVRTIAGLGLQAAEALDHAHTRGILHRDIKPGNLLLDVECRLWVADFGLAQIQGSHGVTLSGDVLGTLRYMSPEQALGKRVVIDGRTDIYSLGVTLHELLTLNPAYDGKERVEVLRRIAHEEPPPIRRSNPVVPIDLETIIRKAAAKEPNDRYATAREMADDLRRFLDDRTIAATRPSPWTRARKWMHRHRQATLAIFLFAVTAVTAVVGWTLDRSNRQMQLSQQVGRGLGAARGSLQSGDTDGANRQLSEARGRLIQAQYGTGPLSRELAQLSQEVRARIEAENQFQRFQDLRRKVHSSMPHISAEQLSFSLKQCRNALALYRVLDTSPWEPPAAYQNLPPSLEAATRAGIHELLFLLARLEVKATYNAADRAQAHRRAIDSLRRLEAMVGPWPATSLWMAESWESVGEKELARQAIRRAEGIAPGTALNDYMIGDHNAQQGNAEDALRDYTRALRFQPDHFLSILGMGLALNQLGRHEAAEAMFTGAIALSPDTTITYYQRAMSRRSQSKMDLALKDLAKMAELDPRDYLAYYGQALVLDRRGDTALALSMLDKAVELNRTSFSSRLNRGSLYARLGQLDKARADFTAVIDWLSPTMAMTPRNQNWVEHLVTARLNRALTFERTGRRADALEDINKALEIDPKSAKSYHCRAMLVRMPAGQIKEAIEDLSQAIQLEPDNPEHLRDRSECYVRFREFDRAHADVCRIVELRPDEPGGYIDRGLVLARQGRDGDAVADVERALGLATKGKGKAKALTESAYYNAACVYALTSDRVAKNNPMAGREVAARYGNRAIELLRKAVASGWTGPHSVEHMRKDADLESIRKHPEFEAVLDSAKQGTATGDDHSHGDRRAGSHDK